MELVMRMGLGGKSSMGTPILAWRTASRMRRTMSAARMVPELLEAILRMPPVSKYSKKK